jgi:uncharacterized protein involved in type VI secretion and phage assembly
VNNILNEVGSHADRNEKDRLYGVYIGIVTANTDDQHTYRVKVRLPHLPGGGESDETSDSTHWARIGSFLAGEYVGEEDTYGPRGAYFMPEIGDEVLVMFVFGDIANPVVIGRMWSDVGPEKSGGGGEDDGKPNKPVYAHTQAKGVLKNAADGDPDGTPKVHLKSKHEEKKNDLSGWRTRSGNLVVFNDNKDEPAIYLRTSKKHRIEMVDGKSSSDFKGILIADADDNYVWLKSGSAKGDIEIKTKGNVRIDAEKNIELHAKENVKITSDKNTDHKAQNYSVKAEAQYKVECKMGTVQASAMLQLTGKPINLN